jgi:hypothetical protein
MRGAPSGALRFCLLPRREQRVVEPPLLVRKSTAGKAVRFRRPVTVRLVA